MKISLSNHHHKLLLLQLLLHIGAIGGLIIYWDPWWLLVALLGKIIIKTFGAEIGYHRLIAHRSFTTHSWIENILLFLGTMTAMGSAVGWAANHRVHHRNSDKQGDPHPATESFRTWFWIGTNSKVTVNPTVVKDLLRKEVYLFQRNYYFTIVYSVYALVALIDIKFLIYFFLIPGALAMTSGGLLNVVCHKWGYRNFDTIDNSKNNFWVNMYCNFSGMGLHNNHHMYPNRWSNKIKSNEIDLCTPIIKLIMKKETNMEQVKCGCGRSPTGFCIGWHNLSEEAYKRLLEDQIKVVEQQKENK